MKGIDFARLAHIVTQAKSFISRNPPLICATELSIIIHLIMRRDPSRKKGTRPFQVTRDK